jgi:hypothetical protein
MEEEDEEDEEEEVVGYIFGGTGCKRMVAVVVVLPISVAAGFSCWAR